MSKYEITKLVPIPPSRIRTSKYPFSDMEVGDSFYVPWDDTLKSALKQSCYYTSRKTKMKFRVVNDGQGWRVFRVL